MKHFEDTIREWQRLDRGRTPGRVGTRAGGLWMGSYPVYAFERTTDAEYLALSAQLVARLLRRLGAAKAHIVRLRRQLAQAQNRKTTSEQDWPNISRRLRQRVDELEELLRYRETQLADERAHVLDLLRSGHSWSGPDGKRYCLVWHDRTLTENVEGG